MGLIRTTIDIPFIRNGMPYGPITFEAATPDGAIVFNSGRTYAGLVRANLDGAVLATATVTRIDDFNVTISLTDTQVATIVTGLTFSASFDGVLSSVCFIELIRTDTTPDEQVGAILKIDVVK